MVDDPVRKELYGLYYKIANTLRLMETKCSLRCSSSYSPTRLLQTKHPVCRIYGPYTDIGQQQRTLSTRFRSIQNPLGLRHCRYLDVLSVGLDWRWDGRWKSD